MLYSKTLPLRGVGRSRLSGTLRLGSLERGTRLEPVLPTDFCGEITVYAVRAGTVHCAEHRGGFYYVGIKGINGAIIVQNGCIIAAAFSGTSAPEREKAFSAVRMAEAKRASALQKSSMPPENRTTAQNEPVPKNVCAADAFPELKSDVARALMARANRLFAPPDDGAEEFVPRPYVRPDASAPQQTAEPIGRESPLACPPANARGSTVRGRCDRCRTNGTPRNRG